MLVIAGYGGCGCRGDSRAAIKRRATGDPSEVCEIDCWYCAAQVTPTANDESSAMGIDGAGSKFPKVMVQKPNASASTEVEARTGYLGFKEGEFALRKFDGGSKADINEIRKAIDGNNLDEIVFRTEAGEYFVVYADELEGDFKKNDSISIGEITGTIVEVDDEVNEKRVAGGVMVSAVLLAARYGAALLPRLAVGSATGYGAEGVRGMSTFAGAAGGGLGGWVAGKTINALAGLTGTDDRRIREKSEEVRPQGWQKK